MTTPHSIPQNAGRAQSPPSGGGFALPRRSYLTAAYDRQTVVVTALRADGRARVALWRAVRVQAALAADWRRAWRAEG